MFAIMEMLQRATALPLATVNQPVEAAHPPETTSSNNHTIKENLDNLLSQKINEAIAQRKNKGRPISIKEDPFIEELMSVHLPTKFKEPTDVFDDTNDPIDHIRTFQDRVRLHGWSDAITCRTFSMTLRKDARERFDTLPTQSITSFANFANKFAICFSNSTRKKKTAI
ncbi:Peptidase A2 domain-containing protein [Abeliophyllum distichum]|uniref:Peptidase A2 domain-containing protein n=1 Tax=Abeliophyllum distichum TaxID=126358 RepID=A0ABD1PBJ6_9LAMI